MRLSENFTLAEFTKSDTAIRLVLDNNPTDEHLENIQHLVDTICQPVRDHYGKAVRVTSGYRSGPLNRAIGGSKNSQHSKGEAVDFEISGIDNKELAKWIVENCEFDQLILEFYDPEVGGNSGWVHVSVKKGGGNRKSVLRAFKRSGRTVYEKIEL